MFGRALPSRRDSRWHAPKPAGMVPVSCIDSSAGRASVSKAVGRRFDPCSVRHVATQGVAMTPYDMVREFHAKVGQRDALSPDLTDDRVRNLRLRLIDEERKELGEALAADNVVEVADALADLMYVVIGSALQWGIPIERVFAEVHRSNMTKGEGPKRADGKILKGPNYSPPDIAGVLNETP